MSELYLMHHGVKGMHWGVRRYQNPDGSLTDAGKKHYRGPFKNFRRKMAQNREEKRYLHSKMNAAQAKRGYRPQSREMRKLHADYEREMNTDRMRMLRAEARLANKEYDESLDRYADSMHDYVDNARKKDRSAITDTLHSVNVGLTLTDLMDKSAKLSANDKYRKAYKEIDRKYVNKFKDLTIKELNFSDVEKGRQLMEKHNMWNKYDNANWMRQKYAYAGN